MSNVWPKVEANERSQERALSVEEWLALDEDEQGELVDGRLVEEEVPDFTHELTVAWLVRVLGAWLSGCFGNTNHRRDGRAAATDFGRRRIRGDYLPGSRRSQASTLVDA